MYPYIIVFYFTTIIFVIAKSILKNVMFTWKCAVDEMYVTSLPVILPSKEYHHRTCFIYIWGKCIFDAICVSCAACIFLPICIKCVKMKNTIKFPYISFIHLLQPSPTKVRHVPMTEILVNGMQWKSKHKNIVKYEMICIYLKTKT